MLEPGNMVTVVIEVPRGSFVKRKPTGEVDFISPFPCPYNYGSVEGTLGCDGDPLDSIVLGRRLPYGLRVRVRVHGFVDFVDGGVPDPKWVCGGLSLSPADRAGVERFFRVYAQFKRGVHALRGTSRGPTACLGWAGDES